MSRYTYNSALVSQTLDELSSAYKALDNTNAEIKKGLDVIYSAQGSENIQGDFSFLTNYRTKVTDIINETSTEISKKASEIEDYENTPWYKKIFASLGLGALKLVEGLGAFGESIIDGVVSITGFVGGLFSSDFKDACAEFVKKDYVGDKFAEWYEGDGALGWLNDNSYFSHESTCANVLKGFGTAAGYIIVGVATGGAGFAGLAASAGVAFVGGVGGGTQSGLQQGLSFNQAFGKGVKQGATAAATTLIVGGLAQKLGSLAKVGSSTDEIVNSMDDVGSAVLKEGDDFINQLDDVTREIIAEGGDDTINVLGKLTGKDGTQAFVIKNANGTKGILGLGKDGGFTTLMGQGSDELIDAVVKAGGSFDEVVSSTSTALSTTVNGVEATAQATKATADAASKTGFIGNVLNKGDKIITNFAQGTKVGQGLSNAAATIGGRGIGGVAAASGQGFGKTPIAQASEGTQLRVAAGEGPTRAQQLANDTAEIRNNNGLSVDLPNLKETPSANNSNGSNNQGTRNPNSNPSGNVTTQPDFKVPERTEPQPKPEPNPKPQPKPEPNPQPKPKPEPNPQPNPKPQPKPEPNPNPQPKPEPNPQPKPKPIIDSTHDYKDLTSTSNSSKSSNDLMDSLGNSTGSFSDMISGTDIPTSSTPILSSNETAPKSSSVIPVVAGLGAAGLAGVGTKAFLDKKENADEEEEEDSITTEEWQEDEDSMSIDYGEEENAEADYLTPSDEYAFQES